jgi:ubiquinol-cytochrome c reductase cytochrome c1 subunit
MGEPVGEFRKNLGIAVLVVLALLFVLSYALNREFWKDVH